MLIKIIQILFFNLIISFAFISEAALAATLDAPFTINANEQLKINFHLPLSNSSWSTSNPSNTLYLAFGNGAYGTATQATAFLYNGYTLLGINSDSYGANGGGYPFYFYWTDKQSSFNSPSATFIDGTSLINRTIIGSVLITFNSTVNISNLSLDAGYGWLGTTIIDGGSFAVIDSVSLPSVTPVPEPEAYLMLLTGMCIISFLSYRKNKNDLSYLKNEY